MNIFIVHSGCDKDAVGKVAAQLQKLEHRANILMLENGGALWKIEARRLIKESQMVLFVVGKNSHSSKNIDWELKKAMRFNKVILYYMLDDVSNELNSCLYGIDRFSKKKTLIAKPARTLEDIAERIRAYEDGEYNLIRKELDDANRSELLEQYKIFLETSESLVARRQTVNSFYVSANTALITIMGGLIAILGETKERIILFVLTSVVGIVLSVSWSRILSAYGTLNGSKMKVISMIENELPAALYDTEWQVMSDKLNNKKYVSFTDSEKKAPKAFIILYILLIVAAIIMGLSLLFK